MYSTILFDFDGTLTASLDLWLQAYRFAFAELGQAISDEVIVQRCFYRAFEEVVVEFSLPSKVQFAELVQLGLWEAFEHAKLFTGVREVLEYCRNEKFKLGIVTSSPRKIVERALLALNINAYFNSIVTADDIINFKPHPEPVLLALRNLDSSAYESLFIGDSVADILAGRAAGTQTGLFFPEAHDQFYDFERLIEAEPHFVFRHYDELIRWLSRPTDDESSIKDKLSSVS